MILIIHTKLLVLINASLILRMVKLVNSWPSTFSFNQSIIIYITILVTSANQDILKCPDKKLYPIDIQGLPKQIMKDPYWLILDSNVSKTIKIQFYLLIKRIIWWKIVKFTTVLREFLHSIIMVVWGANWDTLERSIIKMIIVSMDTSILVLKWIKSIMSWMVSVI